MKKLLVSLSLVLILVICTCITATAEGGNRYRVTTDNPRDGLRMHTGIQSKETVGSMPHGYEFTAIEENGNWKKTVYNGQVVWVFGGNGLLTWLNAPQVLCTMYVRAEVESLYFRSEPTTSSSPLGSFSAGAELSVIGYVGGWTKVIHNGVIGYVSSQYLTDSRPSTASAPGTAAVSVAGYKYVTASSLNIRKGPSTSTDIVGGAEKGTKLAFIKTVGEWSQILFNGSAAYVYSRYISASAPSVTSSEEENAGSIRTSVNASRLNVRDSHSSGSSVIGALDNGTKVIYDPFSRTYEDGFAWVKLISPIKGWAAEQYLNQ